ncbi:MAG TPA: hypothetical protein DEF30_11990 [Proteiniclasticum sp.]|nr:hypothetical protein [Proteiniclasticum sp.]
MGISITDWLPSEDSCAPFTFPLLREGNSAKQVPLPPKAFPIHGHVILFVPAFLFSQILQKSAIFQA